MTEKPQMMPCLWCQTKSTYYQTWAGWHWYKCQHPECRLAFGGVEA